MCVSDVSFPLPLSVTLKSSNEKYLHRILLKSENARRTPRTPGMCRRRSAFENHAAAAAFGGGGQACLGHPDSLRVCSLLLYQSLTICDKCVNRVETLRDNANNYPDILLQWFGRVSVVRYVPGGNYLYLLTTTYLLTFHKSLLYLITRPH